MQYFARLQLAKRGSSFDMAADFDSCGCLLRRSVKLSHIAQFFSLGDFGVGLVISRLYRYRREFSRLLSVSNTTKPRFLRLFLMSLILILGILPSQFYVLAVNMSVPFRSYSWSRVHGSEWNSVIMIPSNGYVIFDRWIRLACGLLVFCFFGVGTDALSMYKSWVRRIGFGPRTLANCPRVGSSISRGFQTAIPTSSPWRSLAGQFNTSLVQPVFGSLFGSKM